MFKRILVPTTLKAASNSVFPWATTIAQAFGSKLYLANIMPPSAIKGPEILEDFPHLNEFFPVDRDLDFNPPLLPEVPVSKMFLYDRDEAAMLLRLAGEKKTDLICLAATSKRIELTWWSAGPTVERLIREAPCSVFCIRGKPTRERDWKRPRVRHVLLLAGLDDQAPVLLKRMMPWVDRFQSVLHVFPLQGSRLRESGQRAALRELCQIEGVHPNVLFFSEPKNRMQNLLNFIAETPVDLIAMAPETRADFSNRLISDIFIQLLRLAKCPILLLR
jgi:nucleotide-binding universal stress UspA family protein